ncbi:enoyl-CoA hydratase/isomerase family protein [Bradyrhizobium sp. Arg237L]|uniref:enoyl-CoA hydratase/isomerase family protein n=1 Tax=Bradyrhizobium sp. Arg237L TaxID=3003352 RepID=UPI00249ED70B|nr:enoyl-CoA hydratase/isomerase family protein [Bradyrhizobium sp. Arg237L]MDI4232578.1 enoyl-CoA hydratase/isomerase family protein [Bradyrhizobium sp. Arg237L]
MDRRWTTRPQLVSYELSEASANITLNRPRVGKALSAAMVDMLDAAIERGLREGARIIVFRGAGKHMCTGFDLADIESSTDGDLLLRFVRIEQLLQKIYRCPLVTVAIGSGRVYGAGADLFTSCDRRISLPGTSFAFPGSGFGLILGARRLATRIGNDTARRILIAGRVIPASEAARLGLVTDLSEEADLASRVARLATKAVRLPARTVAALHSVTTSRDDDADLAALVNSASYPGLKDRITAYRQAIVQQRARSTDTPVVDLVELPRLSAAAAFVDTGKCRPGH